MSHAALRHLRKKWSRNMVPTSRRFPKNMMTWSQPWGNPTKNHPRLISSISKRLKLAADGEDATGDMDEGTSPQRISPRISPTIGLSGGDFRTCHGDFRLPGMFFSASFGKILNQICRSELIGMLCHTKLQSHF